MIAGGVTLIMPFARIAAATAAAGSRLEPSGGAVVPPAAAQPAVHEAAGAAAPTSGQSPATPGWMIPAESLPPPVTLRDDYSAPTPPARLPAVPASLGAEAPALTGNYRSTLAVPPPPLLDVQAPPPAAGGMPAPVAATPPPQLAWQATVAEPPATYVIRDGDDLTGIATRFYGHPAAAATVWEANRDVIPDPGLLPIGQALRMPPPWSVPGLPNSAAVVGRVIEPPRTAVGPGPDAPRAPDAPGWLAGAAPAAPAAIPPKVSGGTVRLAPGETLESLAVRFYGDRSAATRIWEANRDRLRSPELAVAGMELRLP